MASVVLIETVVVITVATIVANVAMAALRTAVHVVAKHKPIANYSFSKN